MQQLFLFYFISDEKTSAMQAGNSRGLQQTKKKTRKKEKKERISKQKLLKSCHQGQNVTVLAILERLEFKSFSCWPTMVANSVFPDPSTFLCFLMFPRAALSENDISVERFNT